MELNHTCLELLKILYDQQEYISISTLASRLAKTERSVRYSLDLIDEFLKRKKLPFLSRKFGSGIYLEHTPETEATLHGLLATATPYQYKFSTEEREKYLELCLLVGRSQYIPVAEFAERLTVSYSTITADLDVVEKWLLENGLTLVKKSRMGLYVQGDETQILKTCLKRLGENITLAEYDRYLCKKSLDNKIALSILNELFASLDIDFFRDLPKQAESVLNCIFSDESFGNLIFFLALVTQRHISGMAGSVPVPPTDDTLTLTNEYDAASMLLEQISKKYAVPFSTGDCCCLATQFLCSKSIVNGQSKLGRDPIRSKRLDRVTEEIISNVERLYHIDFGGARADLAEHLKAHLIPTIYRIRYHKAIVNPVYDELVAKHSQLLRYTAEAVKPLEECCDGPISDQEVLYIALYFLAAINQQHPQIVRRPQVIVACGSGYGTAQVVASQMSRLFDVDVVAVLSGRDVSDLMEKKSLQCDYIISTVDLPRLPDGFYIKVNPIFTQKDYKNILQFIDARQAGGSASRYLETANNLVEIAAKYGANSNIDQLKYEFLTALIHSSDSRSSLNVQAQTPSLKELLHPNLIRLDVSCQGWKEVVSASTAALEKFGYVTEHYKEAITRNILDFGPGMVMFPGTLISHASPADGCKKLGFGFMSLRHPVSFGSKLYDPVQIVFTLSVLDSSTHMEALMQLFRMLSEQSFREQLFNVKTKDNLLRIIQNFSAHQRKDISADSIY